jgi:DNA polymerase (family 10)
LGARERGCAIEVNGQPDRLDLNEWHCKLAKEIGVKLVLSTDAHNPSKLGFVRYAVEQARRGWLGAVRHSQYPQPQWPKGNAATFLERIS